MSSLATTNKLLEQVLKNTAAAKKRKPKKTSTTPKVAKKAGTKKPKTAMSHVYIVSSALLPIKAFGNELDAQAFGWREREKSGKVYIIHKCAFEK